MSLFGRANGGRRDAVGASSNPGNKAVCKFFLEGRCRFGDSCHHYHPPRDQGTRSSSSTQNLPYHLNSDHIKADLTYGDEKPGWPLAAYGPGRDAPMQLIEGQLEQSPEELRVQYYLAKASGSTQSYEHTERQALEQADAQAKQILSDLDGAIKYVIDARDQHPNREDIVQKNAAPFPWNQKPSFDQGMAQAAGATFGQPSASGAFGASNTSTATKPSPFGSTASTSPFGQPANAAPGFGQPAQLGGAATSSFGQPSGMGGNSSFGQPAALVGGSSAFGKPSGMGGGPSFGQPSANTGASTFGQTSAPGAGSTFGQASAPGGGSTFGQPSASGGGSTFGQASAPSGGSTFGRPSPFGATASSNTPAFGSSTPFGVKASTGGSPFGQPSQPTQQPSAFSRPSQPGQQSTFGKPSPFGSGNGSQSTFGQPSSQPAMSNSTTSAFGRPSTSGQQPSPFSSTSTNTSAFGRPSASVQQQSPFGSTAQPAPFDSSNGQPSAFARRPVGGFVRPRQPGRPPNHTPGTPLPSWRGGAVSYESDTPYFMNDEGKQERIWMPDGQPGPNPDVEAAPDVYEALGSALQQVYDYVKDNGTFNDGLVPEVPPKRDWVSWDL